MGVIVPQSRELFPGSGSDDTAMVKQLKATHSTDSHDIDVTALLHFVEDIFNRVAPSITDPVQGAQAETKALDSNTFLAGYGDIFEVLADTIKNITYIMQGSGTADVHATTVAIFNIVSNYFWDAKVALALAVFAVYYGEFWLYAQYPTNSLARSIAVLKHIPDMVEHASSLKSKYKAIDDLIRPMRKTTWCIVEFKNLPPQYLSHDDTVYETVNSQIPIASYWIIRSIVVCVSQIIGLQSMSYEFVSPSVTEAWELSSLAQKVNNIYEHLRKQLDLCNQHIENKKHLEAYRFLVHLFETSQHDNVKILNALISNEGDQLPLVDGEWRKRVSTDVLRRKTVLLLISDLDVSTDALAVLEQIYMESRHHQQRPESQFEIVWLPVVPALDKSIPRDEQKQQQFEHLQELMPWYTLYHPSLLSPAVTRYIKEVSHFDKNLKLVVLDSEGRIVNPNAIEMMWIWGYVAFPFTSAREAALWKAETWRLELLADGLDPFILQWIQDGKCICLYGGEDMEWIKKFATTARAVAQEAPVQLEMMFIGKPNLKVKQQPITYEIIAQNLSHVFPDKTLEWFFWARLESMWHSKMQQGMTLEEDPIMQEIVTMISFGESDRGWAVISMGPAMAKAKGDIMLTCMNELNEWKDDVAVKGFVQAINDYLKKLQTPHRCNRLLIPGTSGSIPDKVVCAECGRAMEKFIRFRCCKHKT